MPIPSIVFTGDPVIMDTSDYMLKSVYDQNRDGYVDRLKKVTDIEELNTPIENYVPKPDSDGNTAWQEDDAGGTGDVVGGSI